MLALAREGRSRHFSVREQAIQPVADLVVRVIHETYPSLAVPVHGRYRHFEAGGVARMRELDAVVPARDRAKAKIDLVVVSVLLDAGAGDDWRYEENGRAYARSEGLAVASFRAFMAGAFSSDGSPRADAAGLARLQEDVFCKHFQVSAENPLVGVEGRVAMMRALGSALASRADVFEGGRIGGLLSALGEGPIEASALLSLLLDALESIWPGRITLGGHNLGDTWRYPPLGEGRDLIPFHKLSQWLVYSLVEPIGESGRAVVALEQLTGLAEYRNGGLLLDGGVLVPKDPAALGRRHKVSDELIVEWRALTVALLDEVAREVRGRLGKSEGEFPLARVLEGGTWAAGRKIAAEKRKGGPPPIAIDSDGTVF